MAMSRRTVIISAATVIVVGAVVVWLILSRSALPPGIVAGNGRLEATEVDVATKYPGRIKQILVNEGDTVGPGQVVAVMDTQPLEAELRQAQAKISEAKDNERTALSQIKIKQAQLSYAERQYKRSKALVGRGAVSEQERDIDLAHADSAKADLQGIQSQAVRAKSAIDAATAESERLQAQIADNTLRAPMRARIQTRVAEPGEVLPSGGKVLSLVDLSDVFMYVFLPADAAGKVPLGADARIVLDAEPEQPIRAVVSFVSPTAQFTPKTVETAEERHNLSFRVKLQINKERALRYERFVKVGIPGMGYVRLDSKAEWPQNLQVKPAPTVPDATAGASGSK